MTQTLKEIQYEEWIRSADELISDIERGTSVSVPWPYRTKAEIKRKSKGQPVNRWKRFNDINQVIVRYSPGYSKTGTYYSRFVSQKGTPRSMFATQSIYKTQIQPLLLPEVVDGLLDRLGKRIVSYYRIRLKDQVDQYGDLEFKLSS